MAPGLSVTKCEASSERLPSGNTPSGAVKIRVGQRAADEQTLVRHPYRLVSSRNGEFSICFAVVVDRRER